MSLPAMCISKVRLLTFRQGHQYSMIGRKLLGSPVTLWWGRRGWKQWYGVATQGVEIWWISKLPWLRVAHRCLWVCQWILQPVDLQQLLNPSRSFMQSLRDIWKERSLEMIQHFWFLATETFCLAETPVVETFRECAVLAILQEKHEIHFVILNVIWDLGIAGGGTGFQILKYSNQIGAAFDCSQYFYLLTQSSIRTEHQCSLRLCTPVHDFWYQWGGENGVRLPEEADGQVVDEPSTLIVWKYSKRMIWEWLWLYSRMLKIFHWNLMKFGKFDFGACLDAKVGKECSVVKIAIEWQILARQHSKMVKQVSELVFNARKSLDTLPCMAWWWSLWRDFRRAIDSYQILSEPISRWEDHLWWILNLRHLLKIIGEWSHDWSPWG